MADESTSELYAFDGSTPHSEVNLEEIYPTLELLRLVSELGERFTVSDSAKINELIEDGADVDGIKPGSLPIDPGLDEFYDGVSRLTEYTPLGWAFIQKNLLAADLLIRLGASKLTWDS